MLQILRSDWAETTALKKFIGNLKSFTIQENHIGPVVISIYFFIANRQSDKHKKSEKVIFQNI